MSGIACFVSNCLLQLGIKIITFSICVLPAGPTVFMRNVCYCTMFIFI